jgi:hypothetical protein
MRRFAYNESGKTVSRECHVILFRLHSLHGLVLSWSACIGGSFQRTDLYTTQHTACPNARPSVLMISVTGKRQRTRRDKTKYVQTLSQPWSNSGPTRAWIGSRENTQRAASARTRQVPNSEMASAKKCTAQQNGNAVKRKLSACFRLVRQLRLRLSWKPESY